ncbi:MAG: hypothetical protein WCK63_02450 [Betaproteobacteria bacterium]
MESWITRTVAAICAAGSCGLLWFFGVFVSVPWRDGRLLSLNVTEMQVIGVSLLAGSAVTWGALHLFSLADRSDNPRVYATVRAGLIVLSIAAIISGIIWSQTHVQ